MATAKIRSTTELAAEIRQLLITHERRTGRQLKKGALADRIQVSVSSVYAYLNGTTLPPTDTFDRLLAVLDVPAGQRRLLRTARDNLDIQGGLSLAPGRQPVPRQLPVQPRMFIGRTRELVWLDTALGDPADQSAEMISAIGGTGGIGKTSLALHWAHHNLHQFPDGQLFVNLRGFDPTDEPMPVAVALHGFLNALGAAPATVPVGLDAQAALYRSLVADRHMLIVLDNARDSAHVMALLPGSPSCTVLITSRNQMTGLVTTQGARWLALGMLDHYEGRDLLARRLGHARIDAEHDAVTELLTFCGGLPLALAIVAARATTHPDLPLDLVAADLRDRATRLDGLDAGDPTASLAAVLSKSYQALEPEHATAFGLLGLAPGLDIDLHAAASYFARPANQTKLILEMLELVSLLQRPGPARWRMHDLVRLYAIERANHDQPEQKRAAALRRLADYYTHTALVGDQCLNPSRYPVMLDPPVAVRQAQPLPDQTAALAWFQAEHLNLLATQQSTAQQGWHDLTWQLAWGLTSFHYRQGHRPEAVAAWQAGLAAAEQLAAPDRQVLARRHFGQACAELGRHTEAAEHLYHALTLARNTGDIPGQAYTHRALARAWEQRGNDRRALVHARHTLRLCQTMGDVASEADALNLVGWYAARLGDYDLARTHCQGALASFRRQHLTVGKAAALDSLGYIAHCTGQHTKAVDYYEQALALRRALGNIYAEADTWDRLGRAYAAAGHHINAHRAWQRAAGLYNAQHRADDAERIQQQLDRLN